MLRPVLAAFVLALLTLPSAAHAQVTWLCHPSMGGDPCRGDLTTRVYQPDGSSAVAQVPVDPAPKVDCFYVYPTVSNQVGTNATQAADPEVKSIATYQAQRFSSRCRVFAPLYRQVTAAGVTLASQTHDATPYDTGLADVREAFQQYLREDNGGRGFILIGHSQGSRVLRALIRRDVDPVPAVRARLVSAIIPGANVTVAPGKGDFQNVPPCTTMAQLGCVMAWSTFNELPPANARFGRTDTDPVGTALDLPGGDVLCTDPTALSGTPGQLESLVPSASFAPGVIATLLVRLYGGLPPSSPDTPWLAPQDHYTAQCATQNGARVLAITPVGAARRLTPSPDATWGVHLVDLNLPLGNLLRIVGAEVTAYTTPRVPRTRVSLTARKVPHGRRQLVALVRGVPGAGLQLTLSRRGTYLARRSLTLGDDGTGRVRFRIRRAGSYVATVRGAGLAKPVRSRPRALTLR